MGVFLNTTMYMYKTHTRRRFDLGDPVIVRVVSIIHVLCAESTRSTAHRRAHFRDVREPQRVQRARPERIRHDTEHAKFRHRHLSRSLRVALPFEPRVLAALVRVAGGFDFQQNARVGLRERPAREPRLQRAHRLGPREEALVQGGHPAPAATGTRVPARTSSARRTRRRRRRRRTPPPYTASVGYLCARTASCWESGASDASRARGHPRSARSDAPPRLSAESWSRRPRGARARARPRPAEPPRSAGAWSRAHPRRRGGSARVDIPVRVSARRARR